MAATGYQGFNINGRVALVTGGTSGLGRAIAIGMAGAGARVFAASRSAQKVEHMGTALRGLGPEHEALVLDVDDPASIQETVLAVVEQAGRLDILVNAAGITRRAPALEMTLEDWDGVLRTNLTGTFLCCQAAGRAMREQPSGGAIVNIASIEAENPAPGHSHYCSAKAAVLMYTRCAAKELGGFNIRVNAVSPGLIWREGLERAWPEGVAAYQRAVPLGRLGQADDVAGACAFLASDAARWITGAHLVVDGGVLTNRAF
jgi:NAD(P)-dependent dehydrogenase (short-subunit alcohol dehydrogenase family)